MRHRRLLGRRPTVEALNAKGRGFISDVAFVLLQRLGKHDLLARLHRLGGDLLTVHPRPIDCAEREDDEEGCRKCFHGVSLGFAGMRSASRPRAR